MSRKKGISHFSGEYIGLIRVNDVYAYDASFPLRKAQREGYPWVFVVEPVW
jgi:hypothetical protein